MDEYDYECDSPFNTAGGLKHTTQTLISDIAQSIQTNLCVPLQVTSAQHMTRSHHIGYLIAALPSSATQGQS